MVVLGNDSAASPPVADFELHRAMPEAGRPPARSRSSPLGVDVSPVGVDISLGSVQQRDLGETFTGRRGATFALVLDMRTPRIIAALVLSLSSALGAACVQEPDASPETPLEISTDEGVATEVEALGEESDVDRGEALDEALQGVGYESPAPGPGTILPGGHDPGGPGNGWSGGWAGDPQYAPYTSPRDPDPYRAQRQAKQREYDRIREQNRRHSGGRQGQGEAHRDYPGGKQVAPDPYRLPSSIHKPQHGAGPLDDKARCEDDCWEQFLIDTSRCRRIPDKDRRQQCWIKSEEDYGLCIRECSRKYPGK